MITFLMIQLSDLDALPKNVYDMMQRISEVYLADLGIKINEKDDMVSRFFLMTHCHQCLYNRAKLFCTMLPVLNLDGQES